MFKRIAVAMLLLSGCATSFSGSAVIPNGRAECEQICGGWNMELSGMVQMGAYSNGCICRVPGKSVSEAEVGGAAVAATAAVETQRQQLEQQAVNPYPGR